MFDGLDVSKAVHALTRTCNTISRGESWAHQVHEQVRHEFSIAGVLPASANSDFYCEKQGQVLRPFLEIRFQLPVKILFNLPSRSPKKNSTHAAAKLAENNTRIKTTTEGQDYYYYCRSALTTIYHYLKNR